MSIHVFSVYRRNDYRILNYYDLKQALQGGGASNI